MTQPVAGAYFRLHGGSLWMCVPTPSASFLAVGLLGETARPRADAESSCARTEALHLAQSGRDPGATDCRRAWLQFALHRRLDIVEEAATVSPARPNLNDLEDETGHFVLAKALVAVRWVNPNSRPICETKS